MFGEYNTNACPPDASKIVLEAECAGAAKAVGRLYKTETKADDPSGCYLYTNGYVYFNRDPTGAPHRTSQPLCAGTPAA